MLRRAGQLRCVGRQCVWRATTVSTRGYARLTAPLHGSHNPPPLDESDDFVDIDGLAGMSHQFSAAAGSVSTPSKEPLGVIRRNLAEEHLRRSRLQVPFENQAETRSDPSYQRANSRAALQRHEEAMFADGVGPEPTLAPSGGKEEERPVSPLAETPARLPDPSALPYDDERFAEMLLEMEVNGAIDETWQEAKTAHLEDVKEIAEILKSLKVRDICCIDVSSKTSNFDYMMFGTCEGPRHIHLAAWAAQEADRVHRVSKIKRKQTDELWEVVPIGRIVLNLMVESFREEMTLERKWAVTKSMDPLAAANAPVSEGRQVRAHGLWTLTLNLQDLEDFEVDYCKDILMRQV